MFGAQCSTELLNDITHVVAAKRGTVKVDNARKRKGIKIVWLAWFTDSIAFWRHLDETPYLLDDPHAVGPSSSPISDPHQISSDPEPDEDDWDRGPRDATAQISHTLSAINWSQISAEVDEALNETDDDEMQFDVEDFSEDEVTNGSWVTHSANNSPRLRLKRIRSVTPQSEGVEVDDLLRSPLAKRKKMAADRSGTSGLKNSISANDLPSQEDIVPSIPEVDMDDPKSADETEEEDDDDDDDDDDFLARGLEDEEWS